MNENKIKGPIAWMAGHKVASNLLMLILLIGGFLFATQIKQEVFPEFDMGLITITVPYPGASPVEVERGIILALEESIRGVEGIKKITSKAQEGVGVTIVEVMNGEDENQIALDVQREIDRITTFPDDAEEPQVAQMISKRQVMSVALFGNFEEEVLRKYAEDMRDDLLLDKGISQVELSGVNPREISIEISQDTLRKYNLTLEDIASKLRAISVELPSGSIKTQSGEILFRVKERRDYGSEFAKTSIITTTEGVQILLEDIAIIKDDFEETDYIAKYNGERSILINVFRVGKQTPINVSDAVKKHIATFNQKLPNGLKVAVWHDQSNVYRDRLDLLLRNGYFGLALVFVLLAIFLEIRLAFWVVMGIPISFLGAFMLFPLFGVSLNMISLFAFIIALGIVVDDAIVVGENIYDAHKRGIPFFTAAPQAAKEVIIPVSFSILTNMVAFLPLYFVPGFLGKIFGVIPVVVISVFFISFIECLFVLPAHISHQKGEFGIGPIKKFFQYQQKFSDFFVKMVIGIYGPFLKCTLRNRYITFAIAISILVLVGGFIASGRMGFTLFPKVEADQAVMVAKLPFGSPVEKSIIIRDRLLQAAKEVIEENGGKDLHEGTYAIIGGNGGDPKQFGSSLQGFPGAHIIRIDIMLTTSDLRPIGTQEFIDLWRKKAGKILGLESIMFQSDAGGPGGDVALNIELSHKNLGLLETASKELAISMQKYPLISDITNGFTDGKVQYDITMLSEGESLGLTPASIARQIKNSFYGREVSKHQRGRDEVKVKVRLPKADRISEGNIEDFLIKTPKGTYVKLDEVAHIAKGRSFTIINRKNGKRIVSVTADVTPRSSANMVLEALKEKEFTSLKKKYPGLNFSLEGKQADMADNMKSLAVSFPLALLVIYTLLAIPFRSYTQPLIIMISIPFGIIGAIIGHLIMGYSLSMLSMFGVVALSGVVVNDSLVLVEYANGKRDEGLSLFEAISLAGVRRFRPIMLTTLSTFGGLAPMILETSRQARFLIPMAISLGFGILFATLIALILVPSLYLIVDDFNKAIKFIFK